MFKVTLYKSLNVRSGEMPLRFRLRDGKKVDLALETGKMVDAKEMMAFNTDGTVQAGVSEFNAALLKEIDRYKLAMSEVYVAMCQEGVEISDDSFKAAVEEWLQKQSSSVPEEQTLVGRFRLYLEEELASGRFSKKMYRESMTLSRKLERYLVIRECAGLKPREFTAEQVVDFEKFCIDEYLYAANPKYADLYPRGYDECRYWPKQKLQEEPLRKNLVHFQTFWKDLVSFGEVEASPYDGYVPWMQEKKHKRYTEVMGDPISLTMDEFQRVIATPVPESMAPTRDAFILQVCLGLRAFDFKQLSLNNVAVSKEGIPYIYYMHKAKRLKDGEPYGLRIEIPLVRIAFDIVMRSRFDFILGCYNAPYNRKLQLLLRHCGITREVCVYNVRTGLSESLPICDVLSQSNVHRTHMDIVHESEALRGMRGNWYTSSRTMARMSEKLPLVDHFWNLNWAFGQKAFRVDENLNIIEGAPFVPYDPLVYEEQPDKLPGGRTNPYVFSELVAMPSGEGKLQDRVEVRNACKLPRARKVVAGGSQFTEFLDALEEEHRRCIQYGVMLLKILSDYQVTFVEDCKDTVYLLRSALRGYVYSTFFYLNGDTIVLLHCNLEEKHRRVKAASCEIMPVVRALRWQHVIGELPGTDYDAVLDAEFGALGTAKREVWEMRACSSYVSQALRQARIDSGLLQEELFSRWGLKDDCGNLAHAENGNRVLPYKYLYRLLDALGLKAIVVRPGLPGWNAISRTKTMDVILESIGEPVYRWHRKSPDPS